MDEQIALAWIGIGVILILAILIYRWINYIVLKRRWRRSLKRMERSIVRALEAFNQVMMATEDTTKAAKRFIEIISVGIAGEIGYQAGRQLKKIVPEIIKEVKRNERTRKNGDGRSSQGEPTKH